MTYRIYHNVCVLSYARRNVYKCSTAEARNKMLFKRYDCQTIVTCFELNDLRYSMCESSTILLCNLFYVEIYFNLYNLTIILSNYNL